MEGKHHLAMAQTGTNFCIFCLADSIFTVTPSGVEGAECSFYSFSGKMNSFIAKYFAKQMASTPLRLHSGQVSQPDSVF